MLQRLAGRVVVPPAVVQELAAGRAQRLNLPDVASLQWVEVRLPSSAAATPLVTDLGPGETQVLALALESSAALVLLDDRLARRVATSLGPGTGKHRRHFLCDKRNRPVGAELRGIGPRVWRGMAPGTRKDLGFFWLGVPAAQHIVLCESAIDAISHSQMHPDWLCLSTSGVRANPAWLPGLLARGYQIHCGFDADRPGDAAAARMITLHPAVQRRRPSAHDWNDLLTSRRQTDRNARSLSIPELPIPPAQLHLP